MQPVQKKFLFMWIYPNQYHSEAIESVLKNEVCSWPCPHLKSIFGHLDERCWTLYIWTYTAVFFSQRLIIIIKTKIILITITNNENNNNDYTNGWCITKSGTTDSFKLSSPTSRLTRWACDFCELVICDTYSSIRLLSFERVVT